MDEAGYADCILDTVSEAVCLLSPDLLFFFTQIPSCNLDLGYDTIDT